MTREQWQGQTDQMLREEQDSVFGQMRELTDTAEKRADKMFTEDESRKWERLNDAYDDMQGELEQREQDRRQLADDDNQDWRGRRLEEIARMRNEPTGRRTSHDPIGKGNPSVRSYGTGRPEQRSAVERFICTGATELTAAEQRALQVDQDSKGGTMTPDEQFVNRIIKGVDDMLWIRQLGTVLPPISADSAGVPSWDTEISDADWTSELATGTEDSDAATGKRTLTPHPLAKRIKVSRTYLQRGVGQEAFVTGRLSYVFALSEEKSFLTGDANNKPLGIFTQSDQGISTSRDVSTGNSATSIKADGLIEALYSLKPPYIESGALRWLFHRDAVKQIRKLKTGDGDYIWKAGLDVAGPTILGVRYHMSEHVPNTFTTGQLVGALGDFRHYWIQDSLTFTLQRLDELYAETNQVGFIGRKETDAMPVLEEAFARVALA